MQRENQATDPKSKITLYHGFVFILFYFTSADNGEPGRSRFDHQANSRERRGTRECGVIDLDARLSLSHIAFFQLPVVGRTVLPLSAGQRCGPHGSLWGTLNLNRKRRLSAGHRLGGLVTEEESHRRRPQRDFGESTQAVAIHEMMPR